MDKKAARRMEAFSQYAVAAAREAYEDSGLEIEKEDPFRAGVMIGSTGICKLGMTKAFSGYSHFFRDA